MIHLLGRQPKKITVVCGPCGTCGTVVKIEGDESDPIMRQVKRWGVTCPHGHGDMEVQRGQA